jgi:predicted PolB exonuclease-like 3'-5' exonuclease
MVQERVCIDIETIPNQGLQDELLEIARQKSEKKRTKDKEGDDGSKEEAGGEKLVRFCSLNPGFGQIVCIGIGTDAGTTIDVKMLSGRDEAAILGQFWAHLATKRNGKIITFNGKRFDVPFIIKRSAILGILPTMRISTRRYETDRHFDVFELLTDFYNCKEKFTLHAYCKMFGLENTDTSSGSEVFQLWKEGRISEIEAHCAEDVRSTLRLHSKIREYY